MYTNNELEQLNVYVLPNDKKFKYVMVDMSSPCFVPYKKDALDITPH
jgi:hypothetical protein